MGLRSTLKGVNIMVTLVWRTDAHFADTIPSSRKDDWSETILKKLTEVGEIAKRVSADAVIDGGDFFDRKSPSRTSHRMMARIIETHQRYPCPIYSCIGNHDCVYGDYRFLFQQPLETLFASKTFHRLYDKHEAFFEADGCTVRVVGVPYHGVVYDRERFSSVVKKDEDYLVVVGHVLASQQGGSMFEGEDILPYSFLEDLDADVFMFGHWHKDQGITEINNGKWVVNTGSLSRGSLSQDNLERKPCCVVLRFSSEGLSFERVNLTIASAEDIFDLETKEKEEVRKFVLDKFIGDLKDAFEKTNRLGVIDKIRDLDIPDRIKELSLQFWEDSEKS